MEGNCIFRILPSSTDPNKKKIVQNVYQTFSLYKMWIKRFWDLNSDYNAETLNVLFSFTAKFVGFLIVRATPFESSSECNSTLLKIKQTWFLTEAAAATAFACILVRGREGERAAEVVTAEQEPEFFPPPQIKQK